MMNRYKKRLIKPNGIWKYDHKGITFFELLKLIKCKFGYQYILEMPKVWSEFLEYLYASSCSDMQYEANDLQQ